METQDIYDSEKVLRTIVEYMDLIGEELISAEWLANVDIDKIQKEINKIKRERPSKVVRGSVTIQLIGKPFVIGMDTFDGSDWFDGYFDTDKEAIKHAERSGGIKKHAYDKNGKHIGVGGVF